MEKNSEEKSEVKKKGLWGIDRALEWAKNIRTLKYGQQRLDFLKEVERLKNK